MDNGKEYWCLRSGDFRPEKMAKGDSLCYPNTQIAMEQLSEAGNLFDNEDDAIEASILVRSHLARFKFIRQELQGYSLRSGMRSDKSPLPFQTDAHQENLDGEIRMVAVSGNHSPSSPPTTATSTAMCLTKTT